jgi:hypothetical protein
MLRKSYARTGPEYRSMTMYEQSQQSDWLQTELESMSLQADSPAKISASRDTSEVLKQSVVDCGQSAPVCLGSFDLDTPSLRTSQTCLMENGELGLSEFSGTFPRSGMMRSGTVYQLPNLARTITEIGSGLWPTPDTTSRGARAEDLLVNSSTVQRRDSGQKRGMDLQTAVKYWPTPNASDNRDRGCMEDESVKRRLRIGKQVGLSTVVKETRQSGTLNPTWVEWLMGFPIGHTDLNA